MACALLCAAEASAQTLRRGETTLAFDATILSDLGIGLGGVSTTAAATRPGGLAFAVSVADSIVSAAPAGGDFEAFAALALTHTGGFDLLVDGQALLFDAVRLEAAASPHFMRVVDADGLAWLDVERPHAQWSPDGRVLTIVNADLLATPALAALLGRAGAWPGFRRRSQ